MVVVQLKTVQRELDRRGWGPGALQDAMGVSEPTVRSLLDGGPVGNKVQVRLFNAFGGDIPLAKLFQVVAGPDPTNGNAPEAAPARQEAA